MSTDSTGHEPRHTTEDFADVLDALGVPDGHHGAFLAYVSNVHGDPDSELPRIDAAGELTHDEPYGIVPEFQDAYQGQWDSESEFAQSEDGGAICLFDDLPKDSIAERYFDWDAWKRDLFISDYWSADAPGYAKYIFRNL